MLVFEFLSTFNQCFSDVTIVSILTSQLFKSQIKMIKIPKSPIIIRRFPELYLHLQDQIMLTLHLLIYNYFLCLLKEGDLPVEMWWNDPSPPQSRTSADWWQTSLWVDWQWTPLDCRVSSLDRKSYTQSLPMPEKSLLDGPLAKPAGKKEEHLNSLNLNQLIKASTNQYIHRSILLHRFDINITMNTITRGRPVEHIGVCFIEQLGYKLHCCSSSY